MTTPETPVSFSLQGGINFRDLGGRRVEDGRTVKRGFLFRSGALHELTSQDVSVLNALPVTHVLDYRDELEAQHRPDVLWPDVEYKCVPANPAHGAVGASLAQMLSQAASGREAFAFMCELYRRLPFANPAYRQLMSWLQSPQTVRVVQHCAIGKDRTGVGSAIVLLALGASRHTVLDDYRLTETTLAVYRARWLATLDSEKMGKKYEAFACMFMAHEAFLEAALDAVEARYGNAATYLEQEFGLDEAARRALQDRYLA